MQATITLIITDEDLSYYQYNGQLTQEVLDNLAEALRDYLSDEIYVQLKFWDEEGMLEELLLMTGDEND